MVFAAVLIALVAGSYVVPWTGFGEAGVGDEFRAAKTLWDWMELAIIPVILAVGGSFLSATATRRARVEEINGSRETVVREYMGEVGRLMIEHDVRDLSSENDERAKRYMVALTLAVLQNLSVERNVQNVPFKVKVESGGRPASGAGGEFSREVPRPVRDYSDEFVDLRKEILQFLHRMGLIEAEDPIISLEGADLASANLSFVDLEGASLRGADLRGTALVNANLSGANFQRAKLSGADLTGVRREGAVGLP